MSVCIATEIAQSSHDRARVKIRVQSLRHHAHTAARLDMDVQTSKHSSAQSELGVCSTHAYIQLYIDTRVSPDIGRDREVGTIKTNAPVSLSLSLCV